MEMASSRRYTSQRIPQVSNAKANAQLRVPKYPPEVVHNRIGCRIAPVQPDTILIEEEDETDVRFAVVETREDDRQSMLARSLRTSRAAEELIVADERQDEACDDSRLCRSDSVCEEALEDLLGSSATAQAPPPTKYITAFPLARRLRTSWQLTYADHAFGKTLLAPAAVSQSSGEVGFDMRHAECFLQAREATWYEELDGDYLAHAPSEVDHGMLHRVRATSSDSFAEDAIEDEPHAAPHLRRFPHFTPQHPPFIGAASVADVVDIDSQGTHPHSDHDFWQPLLHKSPRSSADEVTISTADNSARSFVDQMSSSRSCGDQVVHVLGNGTLNLEDSPLDEDSITNEQDVPQIVESYPTIPREARGLCTNLDLDSSEDLYVVDIDSLKDSVKHGIEPLKAPEGEVTLQVYALSERTQRIGLPIFHLGVEVYDEEHFFTVGGIDRCEPRQYSWQVHSQSVALGRTELTRADVEKVIEHMKSEWLPGEYVFLGRNCQDFAMVFSRILGVADAIPLECCRFANMSEILPPLVISGLREADRKVVSLASMIGGLRPIGSVEEETPTPSYPCRLGVLRSNELLSQVVLPIESEATQDDDL